MEIFIAKVIVVVLGILAYKVLEYVLVNGSKDKKQACMFNNTIWQLAAYVLLWGLTMLDGFNNKTIKNYVDLASVLATTFLILSIKNQYLAERKHYKRNRKVSK
jgi:uncharacterized membrane protein YozB (DUF420 family)